MRSRNHRMLCLAVALAMANVAVVGHGGTNRSPDMPAEAPSTLATTGAVVGGQAIDWITCVVSGIGTVFMPFMGWISGPVCFSAVVRTWG